MKVIYTLSFILLLFTTSCKKTATPKNLTTNQKALIQDLKVIAHDTMEGRAFGAKGNYKTQKYIANKFDSLGILPAFASGSIQPFQYTLKGKNRVELYPLDKKRENSETVPDTTLTGGNVVVKIQGALDKVIVITAHHDHLGIQNGKIYNGADDNASGVAALIAMAAYFKDKKLNHTLLFASVDAEEIGSHGAEYLLNNFPVDQNLIVLNVNLDMIANNHAGELYASGLYHYPSLQAPLDSIDSNIDLLYGHDAPNKRNEEDWTYSSDHRVFHKRGIPYIYFGVEDHKDYHKPTDTFENINTTFYLEAVELIIQAIENFDTHLLSNTTNSY